MKTSIEKSHSKLSNFKLTLICLLGILAIFIFWIGIAILNKNMNYGILCLVIGGLSSMIAIILFNKFIR